MSTMALELAVVTGGGAGLGKIIANRLARRCAHVVIVDLDAEAASGVAEEVQQRGSRATFVQTDMSEEREVRQLIQRVAGLGPMTLLVNNAGGWLPGPQFPDTDDWSRSLDLNLRMPMLATQLALPLLAPGGAVINISSSAGYESNPYGSPEYAVAKAGLIRFTTAVSDFADRYGVRVSCVVPHWIGLPRAVTEYERMDIEEQRGSGGLIDPEVVADTVIDLASDPASAGRVIVVRAARHPYPIDPADSDPFR
jgi:NAD(P)-dependent dehydrogenase (short-subunit alcohol dehydrogenase family)